MVVPYRMDLKLGLEGVGLSANCGQRSLEAAVCEFVDQARALGFGWSCRTNCGARLLDAAGRRAHEEPPCVLVGLLSPRSET